MPNLSSFQLQASYWAFPGSECTGGYESSRFSGRMSSIKKVRLIQNPLNQEENQKLEERF